MNPFLNNFDEFLSTPEDRGGLGVLCGFDDILYHYTGVGQIALIKKGLKCKSIKEYLELGEFKTGWDCLRKAEIVKKAAETCGCGIPEIVYDNIPIYIFSMCRERDDRQMIEHAKNKYNNCAMLPIKGSFVYQFVRELMENDVRNPEVFRCHFLLPCLYWEKEHQLIKSLVEFTFGDYLNVVLKDERIKMSETPQRVLFTLMLMVSAMIKGKSREGEDLSYEKEVRLFTIGDMSPDKNGMVDFGFQREQWLSALKKEEIK